MDIVDSMLDFGVRAPGDVEGSQDHLMPATTLLVEYFHDGRSLDMAQVRWGCQSRSRRSYQAELHTLALY